MSNVQALNQGGSPFKRLTEEQEQYLRAVTSAEEQQRAKEEAAAAAEAEYRASPFARTERFRDQEPPTAEDLGISVRGLAPMRARYCRFAAWERQAAAEVEHLTQSRDRLLTALGAPRVVQAELDALAERDRSGFAAWVLSGAFGEKYSVDTFRRQKVAAELQKATAEAEAARAGLAAVEDALALAKRAVEVLAERREQFARAALLEAAEPAMAAYAAQVRQLQDAITNLAGLREAADGTRVGPAREFDFALPRLGDGSARVKVSAAEVEKAAKPWREALKQLLADPRAKV